MRGRRIQVPVFVLEGFRALLPKGSTGSFKPLFAHSSHDVGGPFAVLFASSAASEDKFPEVSPGSCVVL